MCFIFYTFTATAQNQVSDSTVKKERERLSGYMISGGFGYTSLSPGASNSINSSLQNNGFAPMTTDLISWNITPINAMVRNVVFEVDIEGQAQRNAVYNTSRTTTSGTGVRLEIGYVLLHNQHYVFYPEAGAHIGGMDVHSHQGTNPVLDVSATNTYTAFDFSFNLDRQSSIISKHDFCSSKTPFGKLFSGVVGLTVGYSLSPYNSYWNDNNIDIYTKTSNNVNFLTNVVGENNAASMSMFYIKLRIGFGLCIKN